MFDVTFKSEAVRHMEELKAKRGPVDEIARDLRVPVDKVRRWTRQLREHAAQAQADDFHGEGKPTSTENELRTVRRELEVMRQERDFVKKAAANFAKESRGAASMP